MTFQMRIILSRYRKLAIKNHPLRNSKNTTEATLKLSQLSEAYEVLSQPEWKSIYDEYGEEVLKHGLPNSPNSLCYKYSGKAEAIFEQFYGTNNPFSQPIDNDGTSVYGTMFGKGFGSLKETLPQRPVDLHVNCECTLEELYLGSKKVIDYTKSILGIDQRLTNPKNCKKTIEIKPGYTAKTVLKFKNEGHESPIYPNSDLIIHIASKPHPNYECKGNDLIYTHRTTLSSALFSEPLEIYTIDHRQLLIAIDEVVTPHTMKLVKNEGMPFEEEKYKKGDLYIKFEIEFPKYISEEKKMLLRKAFKMIEK